jgi:electron transport complex protein RnfB
VNNSDLKVLAQRIHEALPQTQCTRCGYPDCAAYAEAVAQSHAAINQCPPGGSEGVARLAAITGLPAIALNPSNGLEGPRSTAVIDEAWCIGCTLCLPVCPTDAILGGNKMMHTVIEAHCTGCELCVAVCPVDCISLENVSGDRTGWTAWSPAQAQTANQRYGLHRQRLSLSSIGNPSANLPVRATAAKSGTSDEISDAARKQNLIQAALASARKKADARKLS